MTRTCESCGVDYKLSAARCPTCQAHPASTAKAIALLGLLAASSGASAEEPMREAVAVYGPPPSYEEDIVPKTEPPVTRDSLKGLEPSAMMGKLTSSQQNGLEALIAATDDPALKDVPSRMLMMNAYAKGDQTGWEKLVKRHLDDIDPSDPDLCYKYALHLSKGGLGRADGVIRWAGVALEHREKWTGDTYKSRTYGLHKMRAQAALALWNNAQMADPTTGDPGPDVEAARLRVVEMATAWMNNATESGKDATKARAMLDEALGVP